MMFQNYALFPHLNCLDNVAFSLRMRGVAKSERHAIALEKLDLVHMSDYRRRMPLAALRRAAAAGRARPARSSPTPRCSCSTSRSRLWIPSCAFACAGSSGGCSAISQSPSSTSPTRSRKRWRSRIRWWSWTTVASSRSVRRARSTTPRPRASSRDFIGGHNVLEGRLDAAAAEGFRLKAAAGAVVAGPGDATALGRDTASVAIRSDLVPYSRGPIGPLAGTTRCPDGFAGSSITARSFGSSSRSATFGNSPRPWAKKEFYAAPVEVGSDVVASWRTDAVHLLGD